MYDQELCRRVCEGGAICRALDVLIAALDRIFWGMTVNAGRLHVALVFVPLIVSPFDQIQYDVPDVSGGVSLGAASRTLPLRAEFLAPRRFCTV